jgi:pseudaminic acid biosynthesis-associated methylase
MDRNQGSELLASNLNFFVRSLNAAKNVDTCIEFGANIGMNLKALQLLYPQQQQYGIEINNSAADKLKTVIPAAHVFNTSIFDFPVSDTYDLTLIKGVLIHINPNELNSVYEKLVASCEKYLLVAEYYNPSPVAIPYRGHSDRLFKREFAGEIMSNHPEMQLIDYGFSYRNDPNFPQDDITWFLMEKV